MYGRGNQGGGIGFGPPVTPQIIKQLLIANFAIFVAQFLIPGLTFAFTVTPIEFWGQGHLWQPFTYMWVHSPSFLGHILMNMLVLWMFGSQLALVWGAERFLRYYVVCGVGAGLIIATWPFVPVWFGATDAIRLYEPTLGASGAIYGVMLAYSLTWPDRTIMLIFPPVAFRAIWLIPALFVMNVAFDAGASRISHVGHLGGVLVGWLWLRRQGDARGLSLEQIKYRWRRFRMRQRLRAVRQEDPKRRSDRRGPWTH